MLIGDDFNKKSRQLLKEAVRLSGRKTGEKISVSDLNKNLGFDRTEMRSYLQYLDERGLINLITIGGPYLFGHISLTEKGRRQAAR